MGQSGEEALGEREAPRRGPEKSIGETAGGQGEKKNESISFLSPPKKTGRVWAENKRKIVIKGRLKVKAIGKLR